MDGRWMMNFERTAAIVDLAAIRSNMLEFRRRIPEDKKLMAEILEEERGE